MAGEAITFDFIGRGAGQLAADFRKTGDNAALAARGARLCADGIEKQRKAADASIGATLALAKADKLLASAEEELARDAAVADAALRGQGDAAKKAGRQASEARGGFASLAGEVTGFGAAADAAGSGGSKLQLAMAGLNLASGVAEPALAGVVVAAGGLAAGFAAAGAGLAAFGLVAKSVFTEASTAATAYATAQQKYASATTSKQRAAALQAEKAAFAGLSPPVRTLAVELGNTQKKWKAFTDAAAPGVVGVISKGLGLLPKIFAAMKPFLAPVEKALSGIIAKLNTGLSSTGFTSFIGALAKNTGPAITKIATAIGNVITGIGGILKAFLPTSQQMLTGIDKITAKFREWGTTLSSHSGFQSLMATFKSETPQAVAILKNLGAVLVNVGKAIFGLSTFSNSKLLLQALLPLSGVMASLSKNTVLVRVALYSLAAVKIGQQFSWVTDAWKGIVKFAAATEGATVAQTIAAAATRAWGLAMDALPWVALAAAVVVTAALVIKYHQQIWAFAQRVWHDVLAVIMSVWGWVKHNWPLLLGVITGPIGIATAMVIKNWRAIEGAARAMWNTVAAGFRWLVGQILNVFSGIIHGAANAFGWVPGLGGKLRGAAAAFDQFRANVNRALGGINGRTVHVSVAMTSSTNPYAGGISGRAAAGMYVSQGRPGVDDQLILAQRGEVVVPTRMVNAGAVDHLRGAIPGFAGGGQVGVNVSAQTPAAKTIESALMGSITKLAKVFAATLGGSGASIVNYARGFLGKIPYVFGGNSLSGGIDCSGFTQQVYGKFGIHAPRTSEAQYSWATRSGPVPGGLAFYVSPGGGPPPGHVAIVQNASSVISQGGGMGPKIEPLHFMPLMGTGVPRGGFPGGAGGGGNGAIGGGGPIQAIALALLKQYGWGNQWGAFNALENAEAGWRLNARNPSSGAYGLAQFINGPSEYFQYGGNPNTALGQLTAMDNYIGSRYGSPAGAWAHEQAYHWYGDGTPAAAPGWAVVGERGPELVRFRGGEQVVPGFASGGQVGQQGAAYLKAWQTRHGGGFGAAWGPVVVNQQIAAMTAAIGRAKTLSGAGGLSAAQHRHWAATAADETRRLTVLRKELTVERAWRGQLGAGELALAREIRAAGNLPSLAGNVRGWKAQLGRDKATVGNISKMLGYSDAYLKAHPPAPVLPKITHTYGGDVANNLGAVLSAALGPFTGATVMDRGGWLKTGFNSVYNGTGRPEQLVPARGGGAAVVIQVESSGNAFDQFMLAWLKKHAKIKGGGNVQVAFGAR